MNNQQNDSWNCKTFFKMLKNELVGKIFKSQIFTTKELDENLKKIEIPFNQMVGEQKTKILESLDEASEYNNDLFKLKVEYLSQSNEIINLSNFQQFIKSQYSRYYYIKAIFFFIIRCIYIISQFYIEFFIIYPKYYCLDNQTNSENEAFWIFDGRKYKIKKIEEDRQKYLRLLNFIFDIILIIFETIVLYRLQRIKINKCSVITFQLIKYIVSLEIILFDFFDDDFCSITKDDKTLEYKKNKIIEYFNLISDIIKLLID